MLKNYLSKLLTTVAFLLAANFVFAQFATVTVTSPGGIAGDYYGKAAAFGPAWTTISGTIVLVDDGAGASTSDACEPIINDVAGKIALIDRGTCSFAPKAATAEAAGAIAVIICNTGPAVGTNGLSPYVSILMGNTAPPTTVNIPVMMLSYNDCQIIKSALPDVEATVTPGVPAAEPGERCENPITVTPGTYTIDSITTGLGGIFAGAGNAVWYAYTPTSNVIATVSSCGGTDSRLYVSLDCGTSTVVATGDDNCPDANGDTLSAEASWLALAGVTYYIHFDDRWTHEGFDWTLSEAAPPNVNVTFNVDMSNETVAGPVQIAGNFNGWTLTAMTDNGDGTWSYTTSAASGDQLEFLFYNGATAEDSPDLADCGVDNGAGGFYRAMVVGLADVVMPFVCFNSCFPCPPPACSNPNAIICDNFDNYTLGALNGQAPWWGIWPGGMDGQVTDAFAASGTQSVLVPNNTTTDLLLDLGNESSGKYLLKWNMYIPTGHTAYYNIQDTLPPGVQWNLDMFFGATPPNVTAVFGEGLTDQTDDTWTYPEDQWFEVSHMIDLDNDWIRVFVNGEMVSSFAYPGDLGGIDFYSINTDNTYYIDDVEYTAILTQCDQNAIICDGLEFYAPNSTTGPQADWWTTWSGTEGTTEDGIVSTDFAYEGMNSLKIEGQNGPQDVVLDLGNRSTGRYSLSWWMYIPSGNNGYYNIQNELPPGVQWNLETQFNADGTISLDGAVVPGATFPHDQWFEINHLIDLDNDWATLSVDGVEVNAWNYPDNLGGIDLYATDVGPHLYYNDLFQFVQLSSLIGDVCAAANDLNPYLGQGQGTTTSTPLFNNTGYTTTNDPATGWDCFGEPDGLGGMPSIDNTIWFTFTGDGQTYFIETGQCGSTDYIEDGDTQMAIFTGTCGNLTPVACNEDSPNAVAGNYISGLELATTSGTVYYMMIDGFNLNNGQQLSAGEFCLNFTQLTGTPVVDVTFQVDMKNVTVSAQGVKIHFDGATGDENMTLVGNKIYTITKTLPVGTEVRYNFKNGSAQTEPTANLEDCGVSNGAGGFLRTFTPSTDETLPAVCFGFCVTCDLVGTTDAEFAAALGINPNPASGIANVTYNFNEATDLNIRLTNTLGQVMMERSVTNALSGSEKLDISTLPSGAYMVVFSNGESTIAKRLIVE